ncbi:hypothetical protein [Tropicimonas sediminicola]|uniref:Porin n=1 Tax=Tropicimonas sediminicola TaxID=1031541 RepID=A0A239MH52_9RHOB|nr:hypothetical protein [Tropicimonas sediminicola]SNT42357.1 hypothetical protein SAMN05421757_1229 [Tropicimonas sediminicola]
MNLFINSPPFKALVGGLALLVATATVGQAESVYPKIVKPQQTPNIVRPCTGLEKSAKLSPTECGTLTLSEVVTRYNALNSDNGDN